MAIEIKPNKRSFPIQFDQYQMILINIIGEKEKSTSVASLIRKSFDYYVQKTYPTIYAEYKPKD